MYFSVHLASTATFKFGQSTSGELSSGQSHTYNTCCKVNVYV